MKKELLKHLGKSVLRIAAFPANNKRENARTMTDLAPDDPTYEHRERGGMIFVLVLGLLLLLGGLVFAWKLGAFQIDFGHELGIRSARIATELQCALHLPWLCGAWLVLGAVKSFRRKREKRPGEECSGKRVLFYDSRPSQTR